MYRNSISAESNLDLMVELSRLLIEHLDKETDPAVRREVLPRIGGLAGGSAVAAVLLQEAKAKLQR